jgi:hypothetical protein
VLTVMLLTASVASRPLTRSGAVKPRILIAKSVAAKFTQIGREGGKAQCLQGPGSRFLIESCDLGNFEKKSFPDQKLCQEREGEGIYLSR